jgi:uncharacterized membrane protein YciS (DUF1049 family)
MNETSESMLVAVLATMIASGFGIHAIYCLIMWSKSKLMQSRKTKTEPTV